MKIVFRADASIQIGTGHIMRCLTLANALKNKGAECQFICRKHEGNLIQFVQEKGFQVHALAAQRSSLSTTSNPQPFSPSLAHAEWLGVAQSEDAEECIGILKEMQPDWLIVDHYAIDATWEKLLRPYYRKLMVIDDLADRFHQCDLLLDQTLGREAKDYSRWVSDRCVLLCGAKYALLRPEFAELRTYSLSRRKTRHFQNLLISMGGVDKDNVTSLILKSLPSCSLPDDCHITVVMGSTAPWLEKVKAVASGLPWLTDVKVNVSNMAQLMADSDIAIGAAGATSWERCCLGLPTIMIILAENQLLVARQLELAKAVKLLPAPESIDSDLPALIDDFLSHEIYVATTTAASNVTDGTGIWEVLRRLNI